MKTFFNMLGPMVNPSNPKNQLIGVFSLDVARLYNYIYQASDVNFSIIHALDGYDEISLTGPFKLYMKDGDFTMRPEQIGLQTIKPEAIYGGTSVEEASTVFMHILEGKGTVAQNNTVIANAAFAIKTMKPSFSVEDCVAEARESLESGKALAVFKKLIDLQK